MPPTPTDIEAFSATDAELAQLLAELNAVRDEMASAAAIDRDRLRDVHPAFQSSAWNLAHYLAMRRRDLRPIQNRLAALGVSSLGRAESHALAAVDTVTDLLRRLLGRPMRPAAPRTEPEGWRHGQRLLTEHTETLLGPAVAGRSVRIMVTMPTEAAEDDALIARLLAEGMNCMRINCAHDGPDEWRRMIDRLRAAETELGKSCRVVMDLAGPKLRTGAFSCGAAVARLRPKRDAYGRVTDPARVWLTAPEFSGELPASCAAELHVPADWLTRLRADDELSLVDARGAERIWRVVGAHANGRLVEFDDTTYVVPGMVLTRRQTEENGCKSATCKLPHRESTLVLKTGDRLIVVRAPVPDTADQRDPTGRADSLPAVGCSLPEAFERALPGQTIRFDDGKFGGVIEHVDARQVVVRIDHAPPGGEKLRADKGINLPDTDLRLDSLTRDDLEVLPFVAAHADIVELSFAQHPRDVERLQQELARLGERRPAIVLKIETRRGFENLPAMLFAAMRMPCCGVMIARGDLAVECGFERLAEVQEEILWVCEAAHVPVIWATQVLETLAKRGLPSRAEITDAAMANRAECVMLNKGPHIAAAIRVLDDILRRMESHQAKKRAMLRELHVAHVREP